MSRILVTGGSGFVADHLLRRLSIGRRHVVIAHSRSPRLERIPDEIDWVCGDITDWRDINDVFSYFRPDYVVHLACSPQWKSFQDILGDYHVNVEGTDRVCQACASYGAAMVHVSSSSVFGRLSGTISESTDTIPVTPYGVSKLTAEYYVRSIARSGVPAIIIRFFNLYTTEPTWSSHRSVLRIFASAIRQGDRIMVNGGEQSFINLMHADDAARALIGALDRNVGASSPGSVINVGSPKTDTLLDIAHRMRRIADSHSPILTTNSGCQALPFRVSVGCARRLLGVVPERLSDAKLADLLS